MILGLLNIGFYKLFEPNVSESWFWSRSGFWTWSKIRSEMPNGGSSITNKRYSGEIKTEQKAESDFFYLSNGLVKLL